MDFLVNWISNIPGFAVPFALAALGLILTEKSGVLSLGAEGFMLMGAMAGRRRGHRHRPAAARAGRRGARGGRRSRWSSPAWWWRCASTR